MERIVVMTLLSFFLLPCGWKVIPLANPFHFSSRFACNSAEFVLPLQSEFLQQRHLVPITNTDA